jgi:hypothetical protein
MLPGMTEEHAETVLPESEPRRSRPAWLVPAAAAAAGLIVGAGGVGLAWGLSDGGGTPAVAGSSASPAAAKSFALTGSMTLKQASFASGPCSGTGGYSDIGEGASVTVYDGGGQVVATGALEAGRRVGLNCEFGVWVANVPAGPKFYQVEVSHRGKVTLSAEDAQAGRFAASLG